MIIVTGGAGFIGSAFLQKLNAKGISDILVVDDLDTSLKWKNLVGKRFQDYLNKDQFFEQIEYNMLPPVEAIFHFGACSSTTEQDSEYIIQNNFKYSKALAEWALEKNIQFIYASSAATYGDGKQGFDDSHQATPSLKALNVYALSKQLFDLWALQTGAIKNITGVKFFNVFGPNEYHKGDMASLIYKSFHQINETGEISLFKSYKDDYDDGEQKRDFVYIKDCNEVLWWLFENPNTCGLYNLGTGKARSWNDLANAVFSALDKQPNIKYIEMPELIKDKYQYFTEAKMDKLKAAGCKLVFGSLEDSVADYVRNYLNANPGQAAEHL